MLLTCDPMIPVCQPQWPCTFHPTHALAVLRYPRSSLWIGCPVHLQGCLCQPGQAECPSATLCIYVWVKVHGTHEIGLYKAPGIVCDFQPQEGEAWEHTDMATRAEKASDLAYPGPWPRRTRTGKFSKRKFVPGLVPACGSWQGFRKVASWDKSFFISSVCLYKTDVNLNLHRLAMQKTESTGIRKCQNKDVQILWNIKALMNICLKRKDT